MTDPMSLLSDALRAEVEAERIYAAANLALHDLEEKMSNTWLDLEAARLQTRLASDAVRAELRAVVA